MLRVTRNFNSILEGLTTMINRLFSAGRQPNLPRKTLPHSYIEDPYSWQTRAILFVVVAVIAATASHSVYHLLNLNPPAVNHKVFESQNEKSTLLALGSSLMNFGLNWKEISKNLDIVVEVKGCGAGSPSEFEYLTPEEDDYNSTLVFTSIFEMSEGMISDSRTREVPFFTTFMDIIRTRPDWTFSKSLLLSYPVDAARVVFPTLGRSWEIMVRSRERLRAVLGRQKPADDGAPIQLDPGSNTRTDRIDRWDNGRLARNLSQLRGRGVTITGSFSGPKTAALNRLASKGSTHQVFGIVVMPVSPAYEAAFVDGQTRHDFETMLDGISRAHPNMRLLRLDQDLALQSDGLYWDPVHLNNSGQNLATDRLIDWLRPILDRK